jgi:hypothetical protein
MIIHFVEQGSKEWLELRKGKVTGTRFKQLFSADDLKLIDELIAEEVSGEIDEDAYMSKEMLRGDEYEPLARAAYEKAFGVKIDVHGFISSSKYPWLGYSPDGCILDGSKYVEGIEIKCVDTKTHVRYIRMNQIPPEHKYQVRLIFLVCPDIEKVTFVSYDPRFYKRPMFTVSVTRQEMSDEIRLAEMQLIKFRGKWEKWHDIVTF